ncbi:LexA family protein [Salidesulfovibrio onnuriiensis]|uniref:LexA family protein n=1 Tax=Salidesulfovibrio onnuriiensis TaxID=2583823 RepID=UPI0011C7AE08|nr:translesion error-prone DNA polymerase V autoproteolytic subunit [Salidesulfovibrio onnuriiensis]
MISFKQCEHSCVLGKPVPRERLVRLAGGRVAAGFPSPAEEYLERTLDLHELLVQRPEATYFVRVSGDSMLGAGIHDGDILVVDRSLTPRNNSVVIASVSNDFTVKRLRLRPDGPPLLMAENPGYDPIAVTPDSEFEIWGVVLHVIHSLQS